MSWHNEQTLGARAASARAIWLGSTALFTVTLGYGHSAAAQDITMMMTPRSVESTIYWATVGDATLRPAFQGLVGHDPETGIYDNSGLASSWEHNDDFTEWTFTLHEDAEFHYDWGPVTAADVVHSFELHTGPDSNIIGVAQLQAATATAVDERTVRFDLEAPRVDFLFAHGGRGSLLVYSKARFDEEGLEGYQSEPAGTGHFRLASASVGQGMVYEKIENHWSGQDALIDTLELRFIVEPSTVLAGLLSGEADIAVLPRELQPDAIAAGYEAISSTNASNQTAFLFNGTFLLEGDEALNPDLP